MDFIWQGTDIAVYLQNSFTIRNVAKRSHGGGTFYDFELRNNYRDGEGRITHREGIELESRILGMGQEEFERNFPESESNDLPEKKLVIGLAIPSEYGGVERFGDPTCFDTEIRSFERTESYVTGIRDERAGPLTIVRVRTTESPARKGSENLPMHQTRYVLDFVFGPKKFDELVDYFSQRGTHGSSSFPRLDCLNKAPLKLRRIGLKE